MYLVLTYRYVQITSRLPRPPTIFQSFLPAPYQVNLPYILPTSGKLSVDNVRVVQTNLQTLVETGKVSLLTNINMLSHSV